MTASGKSVVSVDPLYAFKAAEIESQFHYVVDSVIGQIEASPDDWVWTHHASPEHLKQKRMQVMNRFVADFEIGEADRRYQPGELPSLSFSDAAFDLALCSHFLFLYSAQLSYTFHRLSVLEMLRVANEVRIFPLLTLALARSPYLEQLVEELGNGGFSVSVESVAYEMQKDGNEMLRIRKTRDE